MFTRYLVFHCSSVDDILLGYIVNVLEQLGEDEEFDVDEFADIMAAYIPGFDEVNRYLLPQGSTRDFIKVTGMIEWEQKSRPKKS